MQRQITANDHTSVQKKSRKQKKALYPCQGHTAQEHFSKGHNTSVAAKSKVTLSHWLDPMCYAVLWQDSKYHIKLALINPLLKLLLVYLSCSRRRIILCHFIALYQAHIPVSAHSRSLYYVTLILKEIICLKVSSVKVNWISLQLLRFNICKSGWHLT